MKASLLMALVAHHYRRAMQYAAMHPEDKEFAGKVSIMLLDAMAELVKHPEMDPSR